MVGSVIYLFPYSCHDDVSLSIYIYISFFAMTINVRIHESICSTRLLFPHIDLSLTVTTISISISVDITL